MGSGGEIYSLAIKGHLPNPTSRGADLLAWGRAFKSLANPTQRDAELTLAAIWYGTECHRLRAAYDREVLSGLSSRTGTLLAIATLNRNWASLSEKTNKQFKRAARDGVISLDTMADLPIPSSFQELSASDISDAAVDATEWWLLRALALDGPDAAKNVDYHRAAVLAGAKFSIERGLASLWEQVLWEGWRLEAIDGQRIHAPDDQGAESLRLAWNFRHASRFNQSALMKAKDWRFLSPEERANLVHRKTVISARRNYGRKVEFVIGRPAPDQARPDLFSLHMLALENSYLSHFLDETLPVPGVTLRRCLQAWGVLDSIAQVLLKGLPRNPYASRDAIASWSLGVTNGAIIGALVKCLDVDVSIAERIVKFFTWAPKIYKGLWGAPLVPITGTDRLCLVRSPLANSNMQRCAEILMQRGGLTDDLKGSSKGRSFEGYVRSRLSDQIANNPLLRRSKCALTGLKRRGSGEEIDLLIVLGHLLIVGEVKCWLFPADPREFYNRRKNIAKAAEQAQRKAEWVKTNIPLVARHLGIHEVEVAKLTVVPLVVQNQSFGASLQFDDCVVADVDFLALYLGGGSYGAGAAISSDGHEIHDMQHLYSSEQEAADRLVSTMLRPPVIERFKKRISWRLIPFPLSDSELLILTGDLDDVSGHERGLADMLEGMIEAGKGNLSR